MQTLPAIGAGPAIHHAKGLSHRGLTRAMLVDDDGAEPGSQSLVSDLSAEHYATHSLPPIRRRDGAGLGEPRGACRGPPPPSCPSVFPSVRPLYRGPDRFDVRLSRTARCLPGKTPWVQTIEILHSALAQLSGISMMVPPLHLASITIPFSATSRRGVDLAQSSLTRCFSAAPRRALPASGRIGCLPWRVPIGETSMVLGALAEMLASTFSASLWSTEPENRFTLGRCSVSRRTVGRGRCKAVRDDPRGDRDCAGDPLVRPRVAYAESPP